ncbi:MAG: 2-amino-4-hydroxy-6-hydroxymethyldihydropteridine diphosphokinase [Candidatus Omnitrophica bacterium]|nr:2-amino-4-hydroxy-6-hydroxymethyldihydropteridine diphosphokinase [Candidatus Omnitrophota bacterium]
MVTCFIGLGSNLGDRNYYITAAIKRIKMLPFTRIKKISSIIETAPQGGPAQGPYLNAVLALDTGLAPYSLLQKLQEIENSLGRVRTGKNSPRTIDLDILIYSDTLINEEALRIPHPRMMEREFVLTPLKEIAPEVLKDLTLKKRSDL